MNSGVYAIVNTVTGKSYIGSTKSFMRRKSHHYSVLATGGHTNRELQKDYNNGADLKFIVLEKILPSGGALGTFNKRLLTAEQEHIDNTESCYNVASNAKCSGNHNQADWVAGVQKIINISRG